MVWLPEENAIHTYLMDEPFEPALKRMREALESFHLVIAGELDLMTRIRKALLIGIPPCVVLFASLPALTVEDFRADLTRTILTPLHIVVSARGAQTEVHLLRSLPAPEGSQHPGLTTLARVQAAILNAVESIGMRRLDV